MEKTIESIDGILLQSGIESLDLFASIFAKEYIRRNSIIVSESKKDAEQCAKLSYEFAKIMLKERARVLNEEEN